MPLSTFASGPAPTAQFGEPHLSTDGDLALLSFAPDHTLWSLEEPGILRQWDPRTGKQLDWHPLSDLETLWCFSRDARVLASASDDVTLWDVSSGHILTALAPGSWVTALAFHPDSAYLATGHDDGVIRIWDFTSHQVVHTLHYHKKPISAMVLSPDGLKLAAASEDKIISLWDLSKGHIMGTLRGHTDRIPALAWHPREPFLVSAGWDTTARVWNLLDLEPVILLNSHVGQVSAVAFNHDGSLLACADSKNQVHLWDFASKKVARVLHGPTTEVRTLAFSRDGNLLAANGDRFIHVWETATGQALSGGAPRSGNKPAIAVHPKEAIMATTGGGLSPKVWNYGKKSEAYPLEIDGPVQAIGFSPKGDLLAGGVANVLRLWDAKTGKTIRDGDGPQDAITTLAFSPDGSQIATGSSSSLEVWLWNAEDGEPLLLIPDALEGCVVQTLAFHPQGNILAVGGIDHMATGGSTGAISLWNLAERAEINLLGEGTTRLTFHPSGNAIAAAMTDHVIAVWDAENLQLLTEMAGHDAPVNALAFSPDGKWLVSSGEDLTLRIWNEKGAEVMVMEVDSQVTGLAFSPDGQYLLTAHANTTCKQYRWSDLMK